MKNRYPIIYIRGYAMTESERNETAADPFCGFNLGSTLYRAAEGKADKPNKFVFESPLLRLVTEHQYQHVYQNGMDIMDPAWEPGRDDSGNLIPGIPPNSIIIYRYYDDGSSYLGDGDSRNITEYANGLNDLILKVRELVCQHAPDDAPPISEDQFRCYLVAHSMGGLVARALLQADRNAYIDARKSVDKLFTFSTPHNGIDVLGMNVPSWLTKDQANTFNRSTMIDYLNLRDISPRYGNRADLIPATALDADRIFCMVGTNRSDYEVLQGAVRAFVGHGSDGLVRIDNASLWGVTDDGENPKQAATAYAFRSHSGYFGIVNSEEAYQNLVRFLFGDVRVDIWLDINSVSLPASLEQKIIDGNIRELQAGYQFEFRAAPKGKRWYLTRRQSVEDSPACRTHEELTGHDPARKKIYLSSVFLSKRARVDLSSRVLSYAMTFAAKVPDYVVDRKFLPDVHYEGADLFRGTAIVNVTPPTNEAGTGIWVVRMGWTEEPTNTVFNEFEFLTCTDSKELILPFNNNKKPGISGQLRLIVRPWG